MFEGYFFVFEDFVSMVVFGWSFFILRCREAWGVWFYSLCRVFDCVLFFFWSDGMLVYKFDVFLGVEGIG